MPPKATSKRKTTSPQLKRTSQSKTANFDITSESIASDLAAFRKQGGHIEVLGNTPLRVNVTAFRSKGNTRRKASKAATEKSES